MNNSSATKQPVSDGESAAGDYAAAHAAGFDLALRYHKLEHDSYVEMIRCGVSKPAEDQYARWASMHSSAIRNLQMFRAMHAPAVKPDDKIVGGGPPVTLCFESEEEARFMLDSNQWPSTPAVKPDTAKTEERG